MPMTTRPGVGVDLGRPPPAARGDQAARAVDGHGEHQGGEYVVSQAGAPTSGGPGEAAAMASGEAAGTCREVAGTEAWGGGGHGARGGGGHGVRGGKGTSPGEGGKGGEVSVSRASSGNES